MNQRFPRMPPETKHHAYRIYPLGSHINFCNPALYIIARQSETKQENQKKPSVLLAPACHYYIREFAEQMAACLTPPGVRFYALLDNPN